VAVGRKKPQTISHRCGAVLKPSGTRKGRRSKFQEGLPGGRKGECVVVKQQDRRGPPGNSEKGRRGGGQETEKDNEERWGRAIGRGNMDPNLGMPREVTPKSDVY